MCAHRNYIAKQIVNYCHKLDQKFFGANHDGNITAKCDDVLLATPTAVSKGNMVEEMVITLDLEGNKIDGVGKPFSEVKLHLAAYEVRGDAKAVVHAHPPFATARGLAGEALVPALPEAIVSIGDKVPVAEFSMPGSDENIVSVRQMFSAVDVFIQQGNGVWALGDNIEQAYLRLELVEHLAKIQFYAAQMGAPMTLQQEDIETLLAKRKAAGLGPEARGIANNGVSETNDLGSLTNLIVERVRNIINNKK